MKKSNLLSTGLTLGFVISLNAGVFANSAADAPDCCGDLNNRLKKVEDKTVTSSLNKITMSGAIYRSVIWIDNGVNSNFSHVDQDSGTSRFNITGTGSITDDISVQGIFEVGMASNSNSDIDVNASLTNSEASSGINIRRAEIAFLNPMYGELFIGRGWMSQSAGDLSSTGIAAPGIAAAVSSAASTRFTDKTTKAKLNYPIAAAMNDIGILRKDRIRYNTPTFYGFKLQASHAHQDSGDMFNASGVYKGTFAGTDVAGVVGWTHDRSNRTSRYKAIHVKMGALFPLSFSKKEGTGLNISLAWASKKTKNAPAKGNIYFGKLGMIERFIDAGNTALAIDYGRFKNILSEGTTSIVRPQGDSWGVTISQKLDGFALETFATYRNYSFKRKNSGSRYNDVNLALFGFAVKM